MTSIKTCIATFTLIPSYNLAVTLAGTGANLAAASFNAVTSNPSGINCGSNCTKSYTSGTQVTLTASAPAGTTFNGWSGGVCSGTGACTVTMDAAKTVTANFSLKPVLTVTKSGTGLGTVTSLLPDGRINCGLICSNTSATYDQGTSVTLTAEAFTNNTFKSWSDGACNGSTNLSCTITMDSNKTVNAKFDVNAKTYNCPPLPLPLGNGYEWNTVPTYIQTWDNGTSAWWPAGDPVTDYNINASTNSCRYKCADFYVWDSVKCVNTRITTCTELQNMNPSFIGTYILANEIDCSNSALAGDPLNHGGAGFLQINNFTSRLNGNGYKIKNLYINNSVHGGGLFSSINSGGMVSNVGLVGANIISNHFLNTGGLAGFINSGGTVKNSYFSGSVQANDCNDVGGLIGSIGAGATVENSYSSGQVISNNKPNGSAGGLVGRSSGTIRNSYSTAGVIYNSASGNVGGLVGDTFFTFIPPVIQNSYSSGSVSGGSTRGGLIGWINEGNYTGNYWNKELSGVSTSATGVGLTSAQMKSSTSFFNWDFTNVWQLLSSGASPCLRGVGVCP